ncbi:MAG: NAD(+)/NADH kinase [Planctomycetota bacterium]|jgi:NAD+ kinase
MGPVLVLGDGEKPGIEEAVEDHRARLEQEFGIAGIDLTGQRDLSDVAAKWALVFGGDGAILSAARRMGDRPLPTLAVNFGRLGFLTEIEYKQLGDALDRIAQEKIHLRPRMRLEAKLGDWQYDALNDVVVKGEQSGRVFHVYARIGGREAFSYAGDGVVVATPTGSTAYSLAAGGPILDHDLEAIVITPLCAHALSQRPLVVPAEQTLEFYRREEDPVGRVAVDGQVSRRLEVGEAVKVRRAKRPFVLIRVGLRSYYSRLRRTLGWGGGPKYLQ